MAELAKTRRKDLNKSISKNKRVFVHKMNFDTETDKYSESLPPNVGRICGIVVSMGIDTARGKWDVDKTISSVKYADLKLECHVDKDLHNTDEVEHELVAEKENALENEDLAEIEDVFENKCSAKIVDVAKNKDVAEAENKDVEENSKVANNDDQTSVVANHDETDHELVSESEDSLSDDMDKDYEPPPKKSVTALLIVILS